MLKNKYDILFVPFYQSPVNRRSDKVGLFSSGRVGRAGRSGTTFSMVGPDEMPFVYDLHLFLGRPIQIATPEHTQGRLFRLHAWFLLRNEPLV